MMCQQCGAPMVLNREREYYFCEHCGAYHFPNSSEQGVRVLGEDPDQIQCPLCKVPLNMITVDNHFKGHQCPNCKGFLFHRMTFRNTIDSRRARATTPAEPQSMVNEEELHRRVNCPECAEVMETHPYLGPGTIVIDTCGSCNLIWLDYGEINKVINAPGSDRGRGARALVESHWKKEKQQEKKSEEEIDLIDFLDLLFRR